jgi:hypothetical protein
MWHHPLFTYGGEDDSSLQDVATDITAEKSEPVFTTKKLFPSAQTPLLICFYTLEK